MIHGLEHFKNYFKDDINKFVLIGGAATILSLEAVGLRRRKGTKDLDLVFIVELLDNAFISKFIEYIKLGGYIVKQANGKSQFYRFEKPSNDDFPKMIEILSRVPDELKDLEFKNATKLTIEEEISSLSALILDQRYYDFIKHHCENQDGIFIAKQECLIILKIRAYNDLKFKKEQVDSKVKSEDVRKHKNDVFRLAQNLTGNENIKCLSFMKKDIELFKRNIETDIVDMKQLGIPGKAKDVLELIIKAFNVQGLENEF